MKVGVFVCHCGRNIAGTVNVPEVVQFAQGLPHVTKACDYRYMCSQPGQELIRKSIIESGLDRVVIAACSPRMHEVTFAKTLEKAGASPYCLERANIREQCSWVHTDMGEATAKARRLVAAAVARVSQSQPLVAKAISVLPSALVIGGGIAGMRAALDLGKAGFRVYLVERESHLGGHVAQLSRSFPLLNSAGEMARSLISAVEGQPGIEVLTSSEVAGLEGYLGNFKVRVRSRRGEAEAGERELEVGTLILATGYDLFDARLKPEYGYGLYPNVITGMELERMDEAGGPTAGKILVNGKEPQNVVFIQCVGSRDKSVGVEYCSRVCCMYTAKQAWYIKSKLPDAKVTVCYIDIRAFGKGYEEFYERVQGEGVIYRRGTVSEVYRRGERVVVRAEDTLLGEAYEEEADLVVLATGIRPRKDTAELARMLNISTGADGFFLEAHPKLGPVETTTEGIYLAGCCQGPKDISDAIAQGHAAAAKASIPLLLGSIKKPPLVSAVDEEVCAGCRLCESICEYGALVFDERRRVMTVNEALCRGCGACSAICPSGANQLKNCSKRQIFEMITALL